MKRYNVVIVGGGITGLSAAYHLEKLGIDRVVLVAPDCNHSTSSQSAGLICGGQLDNFTRIEHAYGSDFAAAFWRFGDSAFDAIKAFVQTQHVTHASRRRMRLIVSEAELKEARCAVDGLQLAGFDVEFYEKNDSHDFQGRLGERCLAIQDDGDRALVCEASQLLGALNRAITCERINDASVDSCNELSQRVKLSLSSGRLLNTELVILANHLAIPKFLPSLSEAFVSVADQWDEVDLKDHRLPGELAGTVFSANHGYEFGGFLTNERVHLSGGRFLRKYAGIGADQASVLAKVTNHLCDGFSSLFNLPSSNLRVVRSTAGLDCRPCDELPIIGPMYGTQRLLLASGYMGQGLSQGFYAGQCLAELIASGSTDEFIHSIAPARLRSLAEKN